MESTAELERIEARSSLLGKIAPVSVRLNPDVDANTHPYISTGLRKNKFGVAETEAIEMCRYAHKSESLKIFGLGCHIGSQINQTAPFIEALDHLIRLTHQLSDEGIELAHLDLGGGLGIRYADEEELDIASYAAAVSEKLEGLNVELLIEPGRYLVAEAGLLLTRVEYLKPSRVADQPNYAVVDAAMNDLIRPALYQAYHQVLSVGADAIDCCRWDIVGPICESGDFLALQRDLDLSEGSLLAILSTGAYGFVQSSNYNTRARAAEVMIRSNELQLVRDRESISDILRLERIL
jgi:diaminopimelate decarboxylase